MIIWKYYLEVSAFLEDLRRYQMNGYSYLPRTGFLLYVPGWLKEFTQGEAMMLPLFSNENINDFTLRDDLEKMEKAID